MEKVSRKQVVDCLHLMEKLETIIQDNRASSPVDKCYVALEGLRIVFHLIANSRLESRMRRLGLLMEVSLAEEPDKVLNLLETCIGKLKPQLRKEEDGQKNH